MTLPKNKTKIVCTIGPASDSPEVMERMLLAGMNVARLNFSHGDFSGHGQVIRNLRAAARSTGRRLAIMADLPGPKMRIGQLEREPIELKPGDHFILTSEEIQGDAGRVSVSFSRLPEVVSPGATLFLNDGLIQLEVEKVEGNDVHCRVVVGGELRSRKGLNLPGIDLGISAFTDHDRNCMKFALENGVDAISQSFVNSADDIRAVRDAAAELGYQPFVIAKIERSNALDHLEEIIDAADGIMIARGDLGVEVPIEQIPVVQKRLMRLANMRAKPVITATQMLESMTQNRRPTRAEATDVANAILDGTDCVMLSGESAMGNYPVDAVEMLVKIAAAIEPQRPVIAVREVFQGIDLKGARYARPILSPLVLKPASNMLLRRRYSCRREAGPPPGGWHFSGFPCRIVAVSSQEATCQRLQFSSGVCPVHETDHPEDWSAYVKKWVSDHGLSGDMVILAEGPSRKHPEANHRMEVIDLGP